jgi:hypothetical protein
MSFFSKEQVSIYPIGLKSFLSEIEEKQLRKLDKKTHTLIFGPTGSGKTTALTYIIPESKKIYLFRQVNNKYPIKVTKQFTTINNENINQITPRSIVIFDDILTEVRGNAKTPLDHAVTTFRHNKIKLIFIGHDHNCVPPLLRENTNEIIFPANISPSQLRLVAKDYIPTDNQTELTRIIKLAKNFNFSFIYYNKAINEFKIIAQLNNIKDIPRELIAETSETTKSESPLAMKSELMKSPELTPIPTNQMNSTTNVHTNNGTFINMPTINNDHSTNHTVNNRINYDNLIRNWHSLNGKQINDVINFLQSRCKNKSVNITPENWLHAANAYHIKKYGCPLPKPSMVSTAFGIASTSNDPSAMALKALAYLNN